MAEYKVVIAIETVLDNGDVLVDEEPQLAGEFDNEAEARELRSLLLTVPEEWAW